MAKLTKGQLNKIKEIIDELIRVDETYRKLTSPPKEDIVVNLDNSAIDVLIKKEEQLKAKFRELLDSLN